MTGLSLNGRICLKKLHKIYELKCKLDIYNQSRRNFPSRNKKSSKPMNRPIFTLRNQMKQLF